MKKFKFLNIEVKEDIAEISVNGEIVDDEDKEMYEYFGIGNNVASPSSFKADLKECEGKPIKLYVDSVGGNVFAASSMYTALLEYKNNITAIITGVAASAASFLVMAANKVIISPTAQFMIHNPSTCAIGNQHDMRHAADVLDSIKESIINAYENKTHKSREEISQLMDDETWMDASKALELGFVDEILATEEKVSNSVVQEFMNLRRTVFNMAKENHAINKTQSQDNKSQDNKSQDKDFELEASLFDLYSKI